MGEEGRALVGSWVVAVAVGVAWLLLVWLFPPAPPKFDLLPEDERGVTLTFEDPPPEAIPEAPVTRSPVAPTPQPQAARPQPQRSGGGGQQGGERSAQEIGAAFGTAAGSGTGIPFTPSNPATCSSCPPGWFTGSRTSPTTSRCG